MSLICGVFATKRGVSVPDAWIKSLRGRISREGRGTCKELNEQSVYLLSLDLNIFPGTAWADDGSSAVAVSGDPILASRPVDGTRGYDIATLHRADDAGIRKLLRESRGNFNIARYQRDGRRLLLATDRLGARPLYWMRHGDFVLFAGAKRLLCDLPGVNLSADMSGLMQTASFGFVMGERTEFSGVSSLNGGSILLVDGDRTTIDRYWSWPRDAPSPEPETPQLRKTLYEEFCRSVQVRLGSAKAAFAALSGGLDSRCVVSALHSLGVQVHTLNVSWQGSLDQALAQDYARAIGAIHHADVLPDDESGRDVLLRCQRLMDANSAAVEQKHGFHQQLWGGNDGSISVGYVYVDRVTVESLRTATPADAARVFLTNTGITIDTRPLRDEWVAWARDILLATVREEFERLASKDPAHRVYLFLLENHQRRLLAPHFEEIDLMPYEQIEPFFDTEFLTSACRLPVDESINHGLYNRWLSEFSPILTSIPWQVYPGHEPGSLPLPTQISSQWEISQKRLKPSRARRTLAEFDTVLNDKKTINAVLSPFMLQLMRVGHQLQLFNGAWTFDQAIRMADVLRLCGGRVSASGP